MIVDLLVVLVAAKLAAELAERLNVPAVLGEIVAGVVVGPSALALVHPSEPLRFLAEFGVILLLFEVGLDTDIDELRAVGRASLLVATAGVIAPFVIGTAGVIALGHTVTVAIFVGAALTATSVGITARVFGDLRALATIEARTVLGAAIADDVIGLVILTVVVRLSTAGSISAFEVTRVIAVALGFLVVGGAFALRAAPALLRGIGGRSRSAGTLFVGAIVMTLAVAAVAQKTGLAPIVGAFVAGLALARADGVERVRRDVTPVAHLLVPVFFLQIGLEADVGAFAKPAVLAVGGVLLVAAVVGKLFAAVGAIGSPGDKALIGFGMLPRGEVGLIFASIGLQEHVLGNDLYAALLMVVLASTLLAPPLLRVRVGQVRRRRHAPVEATPVPEGGWLAAIDGVVVLRGTPPVDLALTLGLEAAVLMADARPSPRLLHWFLDLNDVPYRWDEAARAQLMALLHTGNARSWRFLETVGLLERVLPELAATLERRRADASELDPVRVFRWATVEGIRRLADTAEYERLEQPDRLMLAALVRDATDDGKQAVNAARQLAHRVGLGENAEDEVALLVSDRGLLRSAAIRPDGLEERRVLELAAHVIDDERARALYLLELADDELETWQRERLDELHARIQRVLADSSSGSGVGGRDVAERRRLEAELLDPRPAVRGRLAAAPRPWLLTQPPGALARQAALLEPAPRPGKFRVLTSGSRIDIATHDRRGLLATVAGVLAAANVEIREAATATWPDGAVAMSFVVGRPTVDGAVLQERLEAAGRTALPAPAVPDAHVAFDHDASPWYTLFDVVAADRPGLLAALAAACSSAGVAIHAVVARTTPDGVAHDRFELTDQRGNKLDRADAEAIRAALSGSRPGRRRPTFGARKAATRSKQSGDSLETARP